MHTVKWYKYCYVTLIILFNINHFIIMWSTIIISFFENSWLSRTFESFFLFSFGMFNRLQSSRWNTLLCISNIYSSEASLLSQILVETISLPRKCIFESLRLIVFRGSLCGILAKQVRIAVVLLRSLLD